MVSTFTGTKRFKVLRKLGEGGMGAVYECHDVESGSRVALKTILFASGTTLLRFKDEFRQFQGIHHPNLVSLGELFEEDGIWYFTMELVRGTDFMAYVRRGAATAGRRASPTADTITHVKGDSVPVKGYGGVDVNIEALRQTLAQVGAGLRTLHEAGKVHLDIKPNNILVTNEGRAVLLDFGISTDVSRAEQLDRSQIVGTPHYMAPEQAAALPVTAAADWYAVGAMLYEALTGSLPIEGTLLQVIEEKQWRAPPDPRTLAPNVPEDLAILTMDLLAIRPEQRPPGEQIMQRLATGADVPHIPAPVSAARTDTQTSPFVGREAELGVLHECMIHVSEHREAAAVYMHGDSGVGKSALVGRFADMVRLSDPSTIVLAGACYEHEDVPYKAVDGVVDALSLFLGRVPHATAAALLPRHAAALATAFPVLGRVEAFAEAPRASAQVDPVEQRSRVFNALRELLARLADRTTVLVTIDDLQWADADSLALLGEILRPPDSPALLLVATVRDNSDHTPVPLPTSPVALPAGGTTLHVERLPDVHARELAEKITQRIGAARSVDIDAIVREAQGYPLFLQELVRYHAAQGENATPVGLDEALGSRIDALEESLRRLLHVTALAPAAIMQGTATRAAGIPASEAIRHIKHLKAAHLVRTTGGTRATDYIEPYHGRVREAVHNRLDGDTRRALHRKLALAMETGGVREYEELVIHWREAGEPARAADYARRAALRAEEALAFDRAVAHYRAVDELVTLPPTERRELLTRLGDALANAGRSKEASVAFRSAAKGAPAREARELARRAAENLLRSGHIDEGLEELRRVLSAIDISYPESTREAVMSLLWSRGKLAIRGLSFRAVDESDVLPESLARIDACWAATTGLFVVDQLRGVDFQYRHLLLALHAGEPSRVIRGLAFHAIATVAMGYKYRGEATRILGLAQGHAKEHQGVYSTALLRLTEGTVAYLAGDWPEALTHGRAAIDRLRNTCRGVAWELATARQLLCWSLAYTGSFEELARLTRSTLRETLEAGDHYAAMSFRSGLPNIVWLAQDDAKTARSEANAGIAPWSYGRTLLQHLMDLVAQCGIDLYEGDGKRAFTRVTDARKGVEDAGLTRVDLNRIMLLDVACRAALSAARSADERDRKPFLDAARRDTALLAKETSPWGRALAASSRAAIMRLEGHPDASMITASAVAELTASHLHVYAAAGARFTKGAALQLFEREHVKSPDRFARVFCP